VVFATRPVPFAVREPAVDLDATDRLGWGVALWLRADDAQALCDVLREAGTPIVAEPVDGPFGRQFTFADPDGYLVTVHDAG
jgi:predicted enzyme related to lactoylglutathione lyase